MLWNFNNIIKQARIRQKTYLAQAPITPVKQIYLYTLLCVYISKTYTTLEEYNMKKKLVFIMVLLFAAIIISMFQLTEGNWLAFASFACLVIALPVVASALTSVETKSK